MFKRMTTGEKIFQVFNYIFLVLLCIAMIYPFVHVTALSLTASDIVIRPGIHLYPEKFSSEAYVKIVQDRGMWLGLANSVGRTVVGTILSLAFMSMGAYAISKTYLPHRTFWTMFMFFTMFFSGGLIPTYLLMKNLGLVDSYLIYILPLLVGTFSLIILRNFFMNISHEIEESAKMDGANDIAVLIRIIIPMSKPILATLALWHAVGHWNSWFDALIYINTEWKLVLQIYLRRIVIESEVELLQRIQQGGAAVVNPINLKAAVLMVSTLPILVVYPFLQKYFATGIMIGSIKG